MPGWIKRFGPLAAIFALFLILNRGAYKGWFSDDELDNLTWTPHLTWLDWLRGLATPFFSANNFRPIGHLYFAILFRFAHLHFSAYVAVLQAFHLLNTVLVWRLARRLGLNPWASLFAAAFFALNVAAFDAFWKPMYFFDVACATLCLLSLLSYMSRRFILAFVFVWLAYKSKELAVMLPAVFLLYEYLLGDRKWKRLIPFFLFSLWFGLQGLLRNPNQGNDYTFHLTWSALEKTFPFYISRLFLIPGGALALLVLCCLVRDKRVWFGVASLFALLFPLFFLPGRIFDAYIYLPEIGAAIAVAAAFSLVSPWWAAAFLAAWIPWNVRELQIDRRAALAAADEARIYANALFAYAAAHPDPPPMVYSNRPIHFAHWGMEALADLAWHRTNLHPRWIDAPDGQSTARQPRAVLMVWDPPHQTLHFVEHNPGQPGLAYLTMSNLTPPWQLGAGFHSLDTYFRWIDPEASAQLGQPAGANAFELVVNVDPARIAAHIPARVTVLLEGRVIGEQTFAEKGLQRARFPIPSTAQPPHETKVEFRVDPPFQGRGIAIVSFGYLSR